MSEKKEIIRDGRKGKIWNEKTVRPLKPYDRDKARSVGGNIS